MDKVVFNVGGVNIEMDKEEVSKVIETGAPIELKSDDLVAYKTDEFETFKSNLANDEYKKGKTAGAEMLIKEAKERNGLDFEGKTLDNFEKAFKDQIIKESNIKPTEQIQELKKQNNTLRENYTNLESEFNTFKTDITQKETRASKDAMLMGLIPDNTIVSKKIALLTLKSESGLDVDENGITLINGIKQQDSKLMQDIAINKDIVTEHLTTLGLLKAKEGGKGGSDDLGGKAGSYDAFAKEMAANNIQAGSEQFNIEMNKRIKDKTLTL